MFTLHGVDVAGRPVLRRNLRRRELLEQFASARLSPPGSGWCQANARPRASSVWAASAGPAMSGCGSRCRVSASKVTLPFGSGSRNPSGPAPACRNTQAGHTTATAPHQNSLALTPCTRGAVHTRPTGSCNEGEPQISEVSAASVTSRIVIRRMSRPPAGHPNVTCQSCGIMAPLGRHNR